MNKDTEVTEVKAFSSDRDERKFTYSTEHWAARVPSFLPCFCRAKRGTFSGTFQEYSTPIPQRADVLRLQWSLHDGTNCICNFFFFFLTVLYMDIVALLTCITFVHQKPKSSFFSCATQLPSNPFPWQRDFLDNDLDSEADPTQLN